MPHYEINSACIFCKHFDSVTLERELLVRKCAAFPLGIPDEIFAMEYDHRNPYPKDQGIRFEQAETTVHLPFRLSSLSQEETSQCVQDAFNAVESMKRFRQQDREGRKLTRFQRVFAYLFWLLYKLKLVR